MAGPVLVGRSRECDIVLADPTVSSRHAKFEWQKGQIVLEDLESANGTFVQGERVKGRCVVRPGQEVTLGQAPLNWHDPMLRALYTQSEPDLTSPTLVMPGRRYACGHCRAKGLVPAGYLRRTLRCKSCGRLLQLVDKQRAGWMSRMAIAATMGLLVIGTLTGVMVASPGGFWSAAERLGIATAASAPPRSPQEASIRRHTVPRVLSALDPHHPVTRNTAAQVAAGLTPSGEITESINESGPYSVQQVARLWQYARQRWRYVNDPHGTEYFASASETIKNHYVGDCDDFAIMMAAMVTAIGGEARVVMVEGPEGGHSYTEACVPGEPEDVRRQLEQHFRVHGGGAFADLALYSMHHRRSADCGVWLNLDWNAGAPGGPYDPERWAVAIYPDGRTETLGVVPLRQRLHAASPLEVREGQEGG